MQAQRHKGIQSQIVKLNLPAINYLIVYILDELNKELQLQRRNTNRIKYEILKYKV